MDYAKIAAVFPFIVIVTPYVMQGVKMVVTPAFVGKSVDYRMVMRGITCLVAAVLGVIGLFLFHINPQTMHDWIVAIVSCGAYGIGGGAAAMGAYSWVNGFLSQSPGPLPPTPIVTKGSVVGVTPSAAVGSNGHREPY